MENKKEKKNKKKLLLAIMTVLIVTLAAVGTVAWLTATSSLTNTFTVGSFEIPTTNPTDSSETISLDGHLYEPSWDSSEEHKLVPGATFAKDPYVGIGKKSEDAVVYVYVENNFSNKVYFTINSGWEKVEATNGAATDTYTSGLFKYTAGLTASNDADVWTTTPLFSSVVTADDATAADFTVAEGQDTTIKVTAFLHQAKDSTGSAISDNTILAAAKTAFGIN